MKNSYVKRLVKLEEKLNPKLPDLPLYMTVTRYTDESPQQDYWKDPKGKTRSSKSKKLTRKIAKAYGIEKNKVYAVITIKNR
jgi:hypothetical protein